MGMLGIFSKCPSTKKEEERKKERKKKVEKAATIPPESTGGNIIAMTSGFPSCGVDSRTAEAALFVLCIGMGRKGRMERNGRERSGKPGHF